MNAMRRYRAVFGVAPYRWFWIGSTLDMLGSQVGLIALVWLVKEATDSAGAVGALYSIGQAPLALGCFLLGPLLDRFSRRRLMIADNLLRGLLMGGLALLSLRSTAPIGLILAVAAVSAFLSATTLIGASAITPALIAEPELLPTANALNQTQWQVAYMLGPALGGLALAYVTAAPILLVDGLTFLVFALALSRLPKRVEIQRSTSASYWASIQEGARLVVQNRPLRAVTVHSFLFNVAYGPIQVALPFLVDARLGGGSTALGLLWSALAAGSLAGGFLVPFLPTERVGRSLAVITILWGLTTLPLLWVHALPVAMLLIFLAGASWAPYNILVVTVRQRAVLPEAYGRVTGLFLLLTQLGAPLGAWVGGPLVIQLGAPTTLAVAGFCCVALGAQAWFSRGLAGLDEISGRSLSA